MNVFAISFLVMLACVLGELLILKVFRNHVIPWRDVVFNLNSGHILMWVSRATEVLLFGFLLAHLNMHWVDQWPPIAQWGFAFIAWDFCFYWMHRMHHRFSFLWAAHVLHHEGEHFNLSLALRISWHGSLTAFPFVAILAVLGVPLEIFIGVSSFHYAVQFYNHTGLVNRSGWLERIMITPSHHRVHHKVAPLYINKNFGGTLVVWDKLFGTFQPELDDVESPYGVPGSTPTYNPFWGNVLPLLNWINLRGPTLRPGNSWFADSYIVSAGVLLFVLVIYYVNCEAALPFAERFSLFAFIFLGTVAIGGLSDEKRWGLVSWIAIGVLLPGVFVGHFSVNDPVALLLYSLITIHGVVGFWMSRIPAQPHLDA
jgi:sterol desaturase/sphingolipid hydroxylase (fatty acid hydroxylase superfamily)